MFSFASGNILVDLGEVYLLILLARMVFSWFPFSPGSPLNPVRSVLFTLTEPVLSPFRRLIPPIGMFDVSFIVAILVVQIIIQTVLARLPV